MKQAALLNGNSTHTTPKRELSKRDEEVVRLIGQHLRELGLA